MKSFRLNGFFECTVLVGGMLLSSVWSIGQLAPATPDPSTPSMQRPNVSSADLFPKADEDYTTPALGVNLKQAKLEGVQLEFDSNDPAFTRTITRVQWRVGDPIDLYIIKPVGVKKPKFVVYLFDYPVETDLYLKAEFCRELVKNGVAAVGFAPALTGQRYHDRAMKEWFVSEMPEALDATAHDVQMVISYAGLREGLDTAGVGVYGEGSGATVAILAAAVDPRIQTLDLFDPWGNWPEWVSTSTRIPEKERAAFLKPEYLEKVAFLDPVKWFAQLKTPNIRLQNVRSSGETPAAVQKKIEAAAPAGAQLKVYANTNAFLAAVPQSQRFTWVKAQTKSDRSQNYRAQNSANKTENAKR
jgi:hypothetical protein